MTISRLALTSFAALTIAGCAASLPGSVAPNSVSASEYSEMSCRDTTEALQEATERESELAGEQSNTSRLDAVSVAFTLLPLGSIFGGDVSGELAQAKGEVAALKRARAQNCSDVE